jgi:dihydroxyacid dehydratase/phosphogluconate dehydratase
MSGGSYLQVNLGSKQRSFCSWKEAPNAQKQSKIRPCVFEFYCTASTLYICFVRLDCQTTGSSAFTCYACHHLQVAKEASYAIQNIQDKGIQAIYSSIFAVFQLSMLTSKSAFENAALGIIAEAWSQVMGNKCSQPVSIVLLAKQRAVQVHR